MMVLYAVWWYIRDLASSPLFYLYALYATFGEREKKSSSSSTLSPTETNEPTCTALYVLNSFSLCLHLLQSAFVPFFPSYKPLDDNATCKMLYFQIPNVFTLYVYIRDFAKHDILKIHLQAMMKVNEPISHQSRFNLKPYNNTDMQSPFCTKNSQYFCNFC